MDLWRMLRRLETMIFRSSKESEQSQNYRELLVYDTMSSPSQIPSGEIRHGNVEYDGRVIVYIIQGKLQCRLQIQEFWH